MNGVLNKAGSDPRIEQGTAPKTVQAIAEFLVVGICTLAFLLFAAGICATLVGSQAAASRDFVQYWASGRQLIHHANPYDADAILRIERSGGFRSERALVMPNPPWVMWLVLPLGFFGLSTAYVLWSLLLFGGLVASVRMVWTLHGRPRNHLYLLGYSFCPALVCLLAGQVSMLLLLGLTLFLRLHRSRPFWAGVSLWFCTLKPHLFLPFGIALLLWVIASRTYSVLAGVAAALGVSTAIALMLDPAVWLQYGEMMSAARIDRLAVPCLSTMLRLSISPDAMWLQYLPVAIGCIWAVLYFRRHREDWDWMAHGSLLMLVSVLVASYTWFTDQAILIPAVLHGVYLTRSRGLLATLALASAVIEIGASHGISRVLSEHYLWTAPAWLAWYVVAARGVRSKTVCRSSAMTDAGLVELPVTSGWTAGPEADEAGR